MENKNILEIGDLVIGKNRYNKLVDLGYVFGRNTKSAFIKWLRSESRNLDSLFYDYSIDITSLEWEGRLNYSIIKKNMNSHNWSGWPGAWCLDCGCADQREACCAENCDFMPGPVEPGRTEMPPCHIHINTECLEPNSNRHNPYVKKD